MAEPFHTLHFHHSEYPERMQTALVEGLRAGRLPGRWLYHSPAQAQRWLEYHLAWSPSRRDSDVQALYRESFRTALQVGPPGHLQVISLGCGGGGKDRILFETMEALHQPDALNLGAVLYLPLDTSPSLVLEALNQVTGKFPGLGTTPLVADLESLPDLGQWLADLDVAEMPRLFTCFGMLPNMPHDDFPQWVSAQMNKSDRLLISANLSPSDYNTDRENILSQYDNPPARAWYLEALTALGFVAENFRLEIEANPHEEDGNFWQILVIARILGPFTLNLFGETITFGENSRIRVFHSDRYTRSAAQKTLERAGLTCLDSWVDSTGEEGIFLCEATT